MNKTDVIISKLESMDYHLIPHLYAESFEAEPWENNWYHIPQFNRDSNWLAKIKDVPVGFMITFLDKGLPYISVVGVQKSFQGKGIGRNLIQHGLTYWHNKGYTKIKIHVDKNKQKVHALYLSLGFKEIGELDDSIEMMYEDAREVK